MWSLFLCGGVYVVVAEKCSLIVFGWRLVRKGDIEATAYLVVCKEKKEEKGIFDGLLIVLLILFFLLFFLLFFKIL